MRARIFSRSALFSMRWPPAGKPLPEPPRRRCRMESNIAAEVELNPLIPAAMEQIINKLLEKAPDLRYQTAADLRADLKRLHRDTTSGHSVVTSGAQNAPLPIPTNPAPWLRWTAVAG